jgi:hypothetical protein
LLEAIDGLTHLLGTLTAAAGGHLSLLAGLALLLALLSLLPLLSLLALLLSLLTLLSLLVLLLALELLDLALQLLGFAAQHLLLEALLGGLLVLAGLIGELLLAARELLELLQRLINFLLTLVAGLTAAFGALVLVLFGIELEIEEAFEVAGATLGTAAPAASAVAERDLDITARGFRAQEVL